jgi:hypothetical protein
MRNRLFVVLIACLACAAEIQAQENPAAPTGPASSAPVLQEAEPPGPFWDDHGGPAPYRVWAGAEYLLWWMKGDKLPPLVTTSPAGTPVSEAGALGAPGTTVLFGGSRVNEDLRSGGRFTLGFWFNEAQTCGIEADFFELEDKASGFLASSSGSPILARPFFDAVAGQQSAELVAFPGLLAGNVAASAVSTGVTGVDVLFRCNLCCTTGCCSSYRLDAVAGYRFLHLADDVSVNENLVSTSSSSPSFIPVGTAIGVFDQFETTNTFHGGDLGLRGEARWGSWILSGRADVALGDNHEVLNINGSTLVSVPGAPPPVTHVGGLLALESNIGHFSRDQFVAIPEFGLKLGYLVTPRIQLFAGYTLLYWGQAVRAGNAIDTVVNPNLLPPPISPLVGPLRPEPRFDPTSLWVQGIDLGLEFRY